MVQQANKGQHKRDERNSVHTGISFVMKAVGKLGLPLDDMHYKCEKMRNTARGGQIYPARFFQKPEIVWEPEPDNCWQLGGLRRRPDAAPLGSHGTGLAGFGEVGAGDFRLHFIFMPGIRGVTSINSRDLTISLVPFLYLIKCGVCKCAL